MRRLKEPRAKLVVSHSAGDEGLGYYQWLRDLAQSDENRAFLRIHCHPVVRPGKLTNAIPQHLTGLRKLDYHAVLTAASTTRDYVRVRVNGQCIIRIRHGLDAVRRLHPRESAARGTTRDDELGPPLGAERKEPGRVGGDREHGGAGKLHR